jgi:uncharacterized coiled-coil DUF342 family protein
MEETLKQILSELKEFKQELKEFKQELKEFKQEVNERFNTLEENMNKRFNRVDGDLTLVLKKLERLDSSVRSHSAQIKDHELRITDLEEVKA